MNPLKNIKELLKTNLVHSGSGSFYIFLWYEIQALIGKRGINLWVIVIIFTFTFFGSGLTQSGLHLLYEKINNPYINWVSVAVDYGDNNVEDVLDTLKSPTMKSKFNIRESSVFESYNVVFQTSDLEESYSFHGMGLEFSNPLIPEILKDDNILWERHNESDWESQNGIIVTDTLLRQLNYIGVGQESIFIVNNVDDDPILVQILAIVSELPDRSAFLGFNDFTHIYNRGTIINKYNPLKSISFMSMDSDFQLDQELFKKKFNDHGFELLDSIHIKTQKLISSEQHPYYTVFFKKYHQFDSLKSFIKDLQDSPIEPFFFLHNRYTADSYQEDKIIDHDYLSIHLKDLRRIEGFANFMAAEELEIDLAQLESKRIFHSVSVLATTLPLALLIIGFMGAMAYLINLLSSYLNSVRRNIGAFTAMGESDNFLALVYTLVAVIMQFIAIGLSFLILTLIGSTLISIFTDLSLFVLFSIWNLIAVSVILIVTIGATFLKSRAILTHHPGSLVYDRK